MTTRSCNRYGFLLLTGVLLLPLFASAQPKFRLPFTVTDSSDKPTIRTIHFGVHPDAPNCPPNIGEGFAVGGFTDHWDLTTFDPPDTVEVFEYPRPAFDLDMRFMDLKGQSCFGYGIMNNIRQYLSRSQIDSYHVVVTPPVADPYHVKIYSWPPPYVLREYCDSMVFKGRVYINDDPPQFDTIIVNMTQVPEYRARTTPALENPDPLKDFVIYMYGPKIPPPPPDTLEAVWPPNGGRDTARTFAPLLQWTTVTPAAKYYRLQVSRDSTFKTGIIVNDSLTVTTKQLSTLLPDTWYYWRVIAVNDYGFGFWQKPVLRFQTRRSTLDAPPRLEPADGANGVSLSPTFRWNNVESPTPATFRIQVATDANFTTVVKDSSGIVDTTAQFGGLQNCVRYYWRLNVTNGEGTGPWSETVISFRTVLATPSSPSLVSPANNSTGVSESPTLTWTGDVCSDTFRLQLSYRSDFSSIALDTKTRQTSVPVGPLRQDTLVYWRVKSINALDSSDFAVAFSFRTRLNIPDVPALVTPANNDTTVTSTGFLRWTQEEYVTFYHLQVATDQNFASLVVNDSTLTDTFRVVGALNNCVTYYWRVRAKNATGYSAFSPVRSFRMATAIPAVPTNLSPPNNKDSVVENVTLSWLGDACTQTFTYHVSRSSSFTDTVAIGTTTETSVYITGLFGNVYYYWHVRASNFLGDGAFSETRVFHTTLSKPEVVRLVSPPNNAQNIPTSVTLVWDSALFARTYRVQVALDDAFTILHADDSTIARQSGIRPSKLVANLLNSRTYYWRVNAKNEVGTSDWSTVWQFTTLYPPAAPFLIIPADGATEVSVTPYFQWGIGERADVYHLQIAKDNGFVNVVGNDTSIREQNYICYAGLEDHARYYWRVRGKNTVGWGTWSTVRTFQTTFSKPANWVIPLTVRETGPARDVIYFGVHPEGTSGVDPGLGEFELPPVQFGMFDVRFVSPMIGQGLYLDIRDFRAYSQIDTFRIQFQPGYGSYPMMFSWPRTFVQEASDSMVIMDKLAGSTIRVHMELDSTLTVSNSAINSLYIVKYGAFPILDVQVDRPPVPSGYVLYQNYPNPFNPSTRIQFSTDRTARIRLAVYDVLGRDVATLANSTFFPGLYSFEWNGRDAQGMSVPSGVYYVRLIASGSSEANGDSPFTSTQKMLLMK